jgi:hypothetical protein
MWRGVANGEGATYEGNRGGYILRRAIDDGVEFVVVTLWESIDAALRDPVFDRVDRGLRARGDLQLRKDAADVVFHGLFGELQS